MARLPAAIVVRLLAGLVTFAVLFTASPLPLLGITATAAAPAGEETDTDIESVTSACPRRATGPGGLPFEPNPFARIATDSFPPDLSRAAALRRSCGRGAHRPHPRC